MLFREGPSHEVIEADPDVHLEVDEKGRVMGIDILNAGRSGLNYTSKLISISTAFFTK